MADGEDGICGCIVLLIVIYLAYRVIVWAADKYTWELVAAVFCTIAIIITGIYVFNKTWEEASSLTEKGKTFIKFGFMWFVLVLIMSIIVDLAFTHPYFSPSYTGDRGAFIFLITLFFNMPGTFIWFYLGARKLKSCDIDTRITEGKNIISFGIFWLIFWIIAPYVLVYFGDLTIEGAQSSIILLVAIPGAAIDIIIGNWSSRIDVRQGWEDLNDAQKTFNREKIGLEEQLKKLSIEMSVFDGQKEELLRQQEESKKQKKELKKLRDDTSAKIKDLEKQDKEIRKARGELETTWRELEDTIKKTPFKLFISEKLDKDVFVREIEELKRSKPGDVSLIKTEADKIISDIKEELKREITNVEDEYYHQAFLEHFKKSNGDSTEHDRVRIKYNPTIHTQSDRRNKEWAEKRRFELSKIEKSIKIERAVKEGKASKEGKTTKSGRYDISEEE